MNFSYDGMDVSVIKSRRRTASIEVSEAGIVLRVPYRASEAEIRSILAEKRKWIEKHQRLIRERREKLGQFPRLTHEELNELANKAACVIPKKVAYYAPIVGVDYGRITIRNQRTRWGSCSSKGNLNFNCILMLFPDEVIDSVVVHELCHRKHMNHSAAFYAEMERVFPNYKKCQKWLKENGSLYLSGMP